MSSKIDYRYLKAFQLTAKHLNFSKAAQELKIAQSAISRQIKLLEESMDEQLIVRSSKRVLLTEKGTALYKAIGEFEDITASLSSANSSHLIRVGILHGLLETWFIKVIRDFTAKFDHELKIETDTPLNMKQNLVDGNLDIIFSSENIQNDLVTSLRLFDEKLVIISKKEIDPKLLHQYTWITYEENDHFFKLSKVHSKQIIMVKSMTAMIRLVKEGVGIAVVPCHTIIGEKFKEYDLKVKTPQVYLSTLNFKTMPNYLKDLIGVIKKHC